MDKVPLISIKDFDYVLPAERISKYPLADRDSSKLLIWNNGNISESVFKKIDQALPSGTLLISNNTRVIHARLLFQRNTGARIEIFCLHPWRPQDYQLSFQQKGTVFWRCLAGNASKWKIGSLEKQVELDGRTVILRAEKAGKTEKEIIICFTWDSEDTFATILEAAGQVPIPPYLKRSAEESDKFRYQTLYAKADGSVAAPTAGLHFTGHVISKLKQKNIDLAELTLHVGAGTFQPVKTERIADHVMHTETVIIPVSLIKKIMAHRGMIVPVGTTSVRSVESLYWLGLKIRDHHPGTIPFVKQWEPYRQYGDADIRQSLQNILEYSEIHRLNELTFNTSLIIVPGYRFRLTGGMITNFHQPQSTLLLLIAAFLGPGWKEVYHYALDHHFRFLSYGDSNLYLKNP
jgi:S-adenosylmethionine:tRNA ribosyltransferase-isomerase